jgi:predicted TIM-barrel fold metal-dependent hydrolase
VSYDTVGAANPVTLTSLQSLVSPDRMLFGSDFPWESEPAIEASLGFLEKGTV